MFRNGDVADTAGHGYSKVCLFCHLMLSICHMYQMLTITADPQITWKLNFKNY